MLLLSKLSGAFSPSIETSNKTKFITGADLTLIVNACVPCIERNLKKTDGW